MTYLQNINEENVSKYVEEELYCAQNHRTAWRVNPVLAVQNQIGPQLAKPGQFHGIIFLELLPYQSSQTESCFLSQI